MLRLGAGVHEGLRDDVQRRVHHLRHVHVEHEVRVPQDVHPEPQRQAEETERLGSEHRLDQVIKIIIQIILYKFRIELDHLKKFFFKFASV